YRIFKNGILIAQIDMYTGPEYSKSIKSDNPYTFRVDSLEPSTEYIFKNEAGDEADNWSTSGPSLTITTRAFDTDPNLPLAGNYKTALLRVSIDYLTGGAINERGELPVYENEQAYVWKDNELKPLGALSGIYAKPYTINEAGQIMGESTIGGNYYGFFWENDTLVGLGNMGGNWVMPEAMNDSGYVVGWSRYASIYTAGWQKAFLWRKGQGMIDLGTLGGENDMNYWERVSSSAFDINNKNQIIGVSPAPGPEDHGFFWQNDSMIDMGKVYPVHLNDKGEVVGQMTTSGGESHLFRWQAGNLTDLGTGGGNSCWPMAINENSQIVARVELNQTDCDGYSIQHLFLLDNDQMRDICPPGSKNFEFGAINNKGQIVGSFDKEDGTRHAFLWTDGAMYQLDDQGAVNSHAADINDEGQIVINTTTADGQYHILLAEPSAVDIKTQAGQNLPKSFALEQNYPNPFNPTTTIAFSLPDMELVSLKVYDLLGREVKSLVSGKKAAGTYEIQFNASHLASGIYYYRLQAGSFVSTKKLILLK
ncbi:MAG: T9SS type A sorting domain-containing protein, partial [Calditrichia bacterium]